MLETGVVQRQTKHFIQQLRYQYTFSLDNEIGILPLTLQEALLIFWPLVVALR